ncbi:MAG: serine protein kinase [Planctomycetia bacterium]|nr:serine protein kinase [Planctomycetia bacterium]
MSGGREILTLVAQRQDLDQFRRKNWEGSFEEYLDVVRADPLVTRNAFQRVYDMVMSYGTEAYEEARERRIHYRFFDDPDDGGRDAVFGLDRPLELLVNAFKSAAKGYGIEKRVLLLHGPVGSSKSTIARLLKKGLERYSGRDEGALYTFGWFNDAKAHVEWCPMNEEPLHVISPRFRGDVEARLNEGRSGEQFQTRIVGELCPFCRYLYADRLKKYDGDWPRVVNDLRVKRFLLSEKDRVGIGTFQPKDEKNQDSTELTGDINYRKIAEYGADSDPRAFNFDGEFNIANRGLIEFVEVLKLDVAFLYDLLGASQEHKVKPKKFAQTDIDEVILGHTNEPEYRRLQNNEFMEALRDRTVKIDVPYVTRLADEIKIYEKDYMTKLQKLKLYNGKSLPGFTEENITELRDQCHSEGMQGISPRYVQDKISNALVAHPDARSINPFMVINELESGLKHHTLLTSDETRNHYRELLQVIKEEYENIVKNEVQRAIAADEDALKRLSANYIDNVKAYTQREKVKNKFTGQYDEPDERLMRSIEEKIDVPDSRKDDFRREIMNYIGALSIDGKQFNYKTNERLHKALELKLFEDQKDTIKLTSLVSNVVDEDTQAKIDVVKGRLIRDYGYDDESATDVLNFVASIFARGDTKSGS